MTSDERVDAPTEEHLGFQLSSAETPMYLEPDNSSRIVAKLPESAVVTVLQRTAGFLRVVTSDDRFGYILDSTPMTPVEGRTVDGWNVQIPDLEPVSLPLAARIPAPVEPVQHAPPDVSGLGASAQRNARVFLSDVERRGEEADAPPDDSVLFSGIIAAAFGMAGLLLAHAVFGLTNAELGVFFVLDVMLPLVVLTYSPKARLTPLTLAVTAYWAVLFGYVGVTP